MPLWRNRDFVLLWTGQVLSTVGTRISSLAFPLLVLAITGSPAQAGAVVFAQTLPFLLLYLPAGALVDRWDRRRVMLPFLADTLSYAASFLLVLFIGQPLQGERARPPRRLRMEVMEGVRWLWRQPLLRALVVLVAAGNLVFAGLPLVLIVRARELGASPASIGVVLAALGVGAIAGSFLAPWVRRRIPARLVLVATLWIWIAQLAALAAVPHLVALAAVAALGEVVGAPFNVVVAGYRYALVPERLLGRVYAAAQLVAWGTIPLGALAAGILLELAGAAATFVALALAMLALAAGVTRSAVVRTAPQPEELPAPV